jgi:uncharacterized protein (DUF697 family)
MEPDKKNKCNVIIHSASVAAGGAGAGLAQVPMADSALIMPIQIAMIISLGKVFDQKVSQAAAKAILSSCAASFVGRGISQILVGWIPGVGNVINTTTAAGITEAIGWLAADNFSKNKYEDIIEQTGAFTETIQEERCDEKQKEQSGEMSSQQEQQMESDNQQEQEKIRQLKEQAEAFINGSKKPEENKDEVIYLWTEINNCINEGHTEMQELLDALGNGV